MQLTDSPAKLVLPFADAGAKNTIPVASQIGITAGAASLTDGFPPLTRTPIAAGGVPPSGLDMNGVLFELSAVIRWANAGGGYAYDSAFATDSNVGGYPKGARVMRSDGLGYWFNTAENNETDPEGAGAIAAGWVPDFTTGVTAVTMTSSSVTLTALQYGKPVIIISGLLTANLNLIFPNIAGRWIVINNTTGAFSITCKTAAGSGIVVASALQIVGDAANIYAANDGAGILALNTASVGGTADALTATFSPPPRSWTAISGVPFWVRAASANATTTPTFSTNGLTAKIIVKGNDLALNAGDIAGAGHWLQLQYDAALDKVVLANPAYGVVPGYYPTSPNFANSSTMVGQRTDAGITTNLSTSRQIGGCDNVGVWASGGAVSAGTITRYASGPGTTGYCSRAAGVTLTGSGQISHSIRMEAKDAVKYFNKTAAFGVTVSHDVGANIDYVLVIKKANSADNFSATTVIATGSSNSVPTGTSTRLTLNNVPMGDCRNGIDLEVRAICGAVTSKNFDCTEFSIDRAGAAQNYVLPDYATELARCQRYLPMWVVSVAAGWMPGLNYTTTSVTTTVKLPVTTCKLVTGFALSAANVFTSYSGGSAFVSSGSTFANATYDSATLAVAVSSVTQGHGAQINFNAAGWAMFTGGEL